MTKTEQATLWRDFVDGLEPGSEIEGVLAPIRDEVARLIMSDQPRPPRLDDMERRRNEADAETRSKQRRVADLAAELGGIENQKKKVDGKRRAALERLDAMISGLQAFSSEEHRKIGGEEETV